MYIRFKYSKSNSTFALTNDKNGFQIGKEMKVKNPRENEKETQLADNSYFGDLSSALEHIYLRGIKYSDANTFNELARDIREMKGMIEEIKSNLLSVEVG